MEKSLEEIDFETAQKLLRNIEFDMFGYAQNIKLSALLTAIDYVLTEGLNKRECALAYRIWAETFEEKAKQAEL